ncbi:MAG: hypothetical protein U5J96_12190 [Ignavibacteriaceae bacterium]|nr:hypothetical protein [Ignavibacteriaceae bacterium]
MRVLVSMNKIHRYGINMAGIYVKRNDYKKALELVNKALLIKPNYPEAKAYKDNCRVQFKQQSN